MFFELGNFKLCGLKLPESLIPPQDVCVGGWLSKKSRWQLRLPNEIIKKMMGCIKKKIEFRSHGFSHQIEFLTLSSVPQPWFVLRRKQKYFQSLCHASYMACSGYEAQ